MVVEESAERDKILSKIGEKINKVYFITRYKLSETDFTLKMSNKIKLSYYIIALYIKIGLQEEIKML